MSALIKQHKEIHIRKSIECKPGNEISVSNVTLNEIIVSSESINTCPSEYNFIIPSMNIAYAGARMGELLWTLNLKRKSYRVKKSIMRAANDGLSASNAG